MKRGKRIWTWIVSVATIGMFTVGASGCKMKEWLSDFDFLSLFSNKKKTEECFHDFYLASTITEPTCISAGLGEYLCTKCGLSKQQQISPQGHGWVPVEGKTPTCYENGWTDYRQCGYCGMEEGKTELIGGHSWSNWVTTQEPDCEETGLRYRRCTVATCTAEETEIISELSHNWREYSASAATCVELGWDAYHICQRCGESTYAPYYAAHDWAYYPAQAATCQELGWEAYQTCRVCEESTYEPYYVSHYWASNGRCIYCGVGEPSEGLQYSKSADGSYYVVIGKGTCTSNDIVIGLEYDGLPIKEIGAGAFGGTSITSVTFFENIISVGAEAFANCYNLTEIDFPRTGVAVECTILDNTPLANDSNNWTNGALIVDGYLIKTQNITAEHYVIPSRAKQIARNAFYYNEYLKKVTIPETVENINDTAFSICRKLEEFIVSSHSEYYKAVDGVLYSADGTVFVQYPLGKAGSYYSIDSGVEYIAERAFSGSINLSEIYLPNTVTKIGAYAFATTKLSNVSLSQQLRVIERDAFFGVTAITSIDIPDSVQSIGKEAFKDCAQLSRVTIGSGVQSIGQNAFTNCNNLSRATFAVKTGWTTSRNEVLSEIDLSNSVTAANKLKAQADAAWYCADATVELEEIAFSAKEIYGTNIGEVVYIGNSVRVKKFSTVNDITAHCEENEFNVTTTLQTYAEIGYDESYFIENDLIILSILTGNSAQQYQINSVKIVTGIEGDKVIVTAENITESGMVGVDVMGQINFGIEVKKDARIMSDNIEVVFI